ncbi:MAG: rhombosortase [Verrucomicrobiaceae bacterium]|nr:MAG: rhombosortase [Verrucomicrobiaceae bacterium]
MGNGPLPPQNPAMNTSVIAAKADARGPFPRARVDARMVELWVFTVLLTLLNWPLFCGGNTDLFAFVPEQIRAGQWWRVITHSFVHVSWYHFLLDAMAFLFLYQGLSSGKRWQRLGVVAASIGGSLLAALWISPELLSLYGLRGLSGVAHGLMLFSMLEMLSVKHRDLQTKVIGLLGATAVFAKVLWEMYFDTAFFASFHLGLFGVPVVACHAGGVLGAFLFWWTAKIRRRPSASA